MSATKHGSWAPFSLFHYKATLRRAAYVMIWTFILSILGYTSIVSTRNSARADTTAVDEVMSGSDYNHVIETDTGTRSPAAADPLIVVAAPPMMEMVENESNDTAFLVDDDEVTHSHNAPSIDEAVSEPESAPHEAETHQAAQSQTVEHTHQSVTEHKDVDQQPIALEDTGPTMTQAEIDAFVQSVLGSSDVHVHDSVSALMTEHMALLDLVPRGEATHIAICNGSWFDPSNWHNGEVPGDDAKVLIPSSVTMDYDQISDARLFTLRIDGQLDFATDVDSKMVIDTFVVAPDGVLTIGTETDPVDPNVDVDIVIANNGAIDTDWDPTLLSRGLISHGEVTIHGAVKDSHEKVIEDPMAGDKSVVFEDLPIGWQIGDTIVIAGTSYDGYRYLYDTNSQRIEDTHEDEVRVISHIDGNTVHFEDPLVFDHAAPRDDLHTSVANYTRNVSVETEDPDTAEIYERGHAMFMHSNDIDVRYAEFNELGRTDKSVETFVNDGSGIAFDSNIKGRYGMHIHRAGTDDVDDPALAIGNSVFGSPGWGFVHHDSNAIFDNNASYDTYGAGFVAESGNEIGSWNDNIAIYAAGFGNTKNETDLSTFDTARTGEGFWFQSRLVDSTNNIAASVNNGFVYFHRGHIKEGHQNQVDPDTTDFASAFSYKDGVHPDNAPVLGFSGNETQAANSGLYVLKGSPIQGHGIQSTFEDFTAWNVESGAHFEYTSHYLIKDFDLISRESDSFGGKEVGLSFGNNISDIVILDPTITGFDVGIDLLKNFVNLTADPEQHEYFVINPEFNGYGQAIDNFDTNYDTFLGTAPNAQDGVTLTLDAPLVYFDGHADSENPSMQITGTKTDSLGTTNYPSGTDNFDLHFSEALNILAERGYYLADDGNKYFVHDLYVSDRLTGEVYKQPELVKIDPSVPVDTGYGAYRFSTNNGEINIDDLIEQENIGTPIKLELDNTPTANIFTNYSAATQAELDQAQIDTDSLWDTLVSGQAILDETLSFHDHSDPNDHNSMLIDI